MLYELQEAVIKLFNDYSSMASEAKCKTKHGEGLKILTPKQMFQRFPIALAQVRAGDTSENSLKEVRQINIKKVMNMLLYQIMEKYKKVMQK